jgi:hypothetical protein
MSECVCVCVRQCLYTCTAQQLCRPSCAQKPSTLGKMVHAWLSLQQDSGVSWLLKTCTPVSLGPPPALPFTQHTSSPLPSFDPACTSHSLFFSAWFQPHFPLQAAAGAGLPGFRLRMRVRAPRPLRGSRGLGKDLEHWSLHFVGVYLLLTLSW